MDRLKSEKPNGMEATLTETERAYYAKEQMILQLQLTELGDLAWLIQSKYWNPDVKVVPEAEKVKLRALIESERLTVKTTHDPYVKGLSSLFNSRIEKGELESARVTTPVSITNSKPGFDVMAGGPGGSNYVFYFRPSTEPDLQADWEATLLAKCSMHDKVLWFFRDLK